MTRTCTAAALVMVLAGLTAAGCTIKKQDAPESSGPSTLGTSITMGASPDILRQDGASQSVISVMALDANGQAIRNLPIRLDIYLGQSIVDYGQLALKSITTGSDGRATTIYTAPAAPTEAVDSLTTVKIVATPVGTDYGNSIEHAVSIRLVPLGVVINPNGAPTASFIYSPSSPLALTTVTFDGSSSFDADGRIVSYAWNFGDGSSGSGSLVQHQYAVGGSYSVSLTVTDDRGQTNTKTTTVFISEGGLPVASFEFSPSTPSVNDTVYFNASKSAPSSGRTIVRYDWDYGDGRQDTGLLTWNVYTKAGKYTVVLTVTDDAGKKGSTSTSVTIGGTDLKALFSYSPVNPTRGDTVNFNAGDSTSTYGISKYEWDFGDGATATGLTTSHVFVCPGNASSLDFKVRLTVTDAKNQTATTTSTITVKTCGQ